MDYQIVFSKKSAHDLEKIIRFIAHEDLNLAKKVGYKLIEKAEELKYMPYRGSMVPEFNQEKIKQLILKPYRIIYRIEEANQRVSILRFWHASRGSAIL